MEIPFLSILVSVFLGVGGWVIGHSLNSKRDQANKRRDIRLERLLECYDSLAKDIAHRKLGAKQKIEFENALTELQLIGSVELITLASSFHVSDESYGSIVPILDVLRNEIRNELGLAASSEPFMWFRFEKEGRWNRPN